MGESNYMMDRLRIIFGAEFYIFTLSSTESTVLVNHRKKLNKTIDRGSYRSLQTKLGQLEKAAIEKTPNQEESKAEDDQYGNNTREGPLDREIG